MIYDKSPIKLASIDINTNTKVTDVFLAFLVINVIIVFKNPLLTIIPIPKSIIIKLVSTA